VISGNIGLAQIEASGDSTTLLSFLSKAGQAAQHAAQLSNQLLTFSKGGAPLKRVASIRDLVAQAAEFSLHGSNLQADVDVPRDLWRAAVDPAQIEQVINALIINAREAMPHGGAIRIAARNVDVEDDSTIPLRPRRYVKVEITDNGGGVDARSLAKISIPTTPLKLPPAALAYRLAIQSSKNTKACCVWKILRHGARLSPFTFRPPMPHQRSPSRRPRPAFSISTIISAF